MKNLFYKIVHPLRMAYWFIFRPQTCGVKCLIEYQGKFLFIRNSYGHGKWTFPGGGIQRKETSHQAAIRETWEEVGIKISHPVLIGTFFTTQQYKRDTVYSFYTTVGNDAFQIDNDEVAAGAWFFKDKLPDDRSSSVNKVIELLQSANF